MSPTILELAAQARHAGIVTRPIPVSCADDRRIDVLAGVPSRRDRLWLVALLLLWVATDAAVPELRCDSAFACLVILVAVTSGVSEVIRREDQRDERARRELLGWASCLPFPLRGWRDLLLAERPQLVVELARRTNLKLIELALRDAGPTIEVRIVSPTAFAVEIPTAAVLGAKKLIEAVLVPLHNKVGILRVEAGTV